MGQTIRYHRVQYGETLATIAKHYYGDAAYAGYIYTHNEQYISDPNKLYHGQYIALPHVKNPN